MKSINLFINWFKHPTRGAEFDYCLKRNLMVFDRVINLKGRPTFTDFIWNANKYPNCISVIANLDIYFDQSIELARWVKEDEVYCLTRWEDDGKGNICQFKDRHYGHPGEWSQDAWIFSKSPIILAAFCMGEPGCDNHLAYLLNEAGYKTSNPSLDIRAIHVHNIDRDASHARPRVGNGKYLNVPITKL